MSWVWVGSHRFTPVTVQDTILDTISPARSCVVGHVRDPEPFSRHAEFGATMEWGLGGNIGTQNPEHGTRAKRGETSNEVRSCHL